MNIQRKNSAHHFRMQSEREQTLAAVLLEVGVFPTIVDSLATVERSCQLGVCG